jgi:endonuclease/exonuclease/phosphatase family metal-dependent hydrolase
MQRSELMVADIVSRNRNFSKPMDTLAGDLNDFQKQISLDRIYVKNESISLGTIEDHDKLKILAWNIERGANHEALAACINEVKPDVACLQEVDWGNHRTRNADVLNLVARSTCMMGFLGIEFFEIGTPHRPKLLAGGGIQGNAILTRVLPKKCFRIELPAAFDWVNAPEAKKKVVRREKRVGARFALAVEFDHFGNSIIVCSTHFEDKDGGINGRFLQFNSLATNIRSNTPETAMSIIAGDFNSLENWITTLVRKSPRSQSLNKPWHTSECRWWKQNLLPMSGYTDPFTCRNWTYKKAIIYKEKLDWIAVRNCEVLATGVEDFNTSDHRPIWTEVKL